MASDYYTPSGEMRVVMHLIYEFKKGVRNLVLCTLCPTCADLVRDRLQSQGIEHLSQSVNDRKVNLFFGDRDCLEAVSRFVHKPLNKLTPEEDFMLGALLGYDLSLQSKRFCERKSKRTTTVQGMCIP